MKKLKLVAIILIFFASTILALSIIHSILLKAESKKIVPNGILVEVNNHKLHIFTEGDKNNKPTLVFMSGSQTPAPVYDFKQLFSLLKNDYFIAVIEKIGYGYADIENTDRDIDIILEESRAALYSAGINGPYVLFPHSISGLEALYWLSKYPEEIKAIIGLDMAIPEHYNHLTNMENIIKLQIGFMKVISKIGIHRFYYPDKVDKNILTVNEYKQFKYLINRNFMNVTVSKNEPLSVFTNAEKVHKVNNTNGIGKVLLFSSNGKELGGHIWISIQKEFAERMAGELILLDCGHYIHHFEPQKIAEKSKQYISKLLE